VLAILAVVVVMVAVAHVMHSPATNLASGRGSPAGGQGPRTAPTEPDWTSPAAQAAEDGLREKMAGLLMAEAGREDGKYGDPRNQTPEDRRRFLADQFHLPSIDYPRSAAPPDILTPAGDVLIVFRNPDNPATSITLLRFHMDDAGALAEIQREYVKAGWKVMEPARAASAKASGWLMRFSKPNQERIVFVQPRPSGKETLAAVYDSRY
jgi:hypothetical protein